jgi:hypothetical protein
MAKEMIDYIREIHKVAGSQVGVHFGEKSPYHIREILRICEAAEQSVQLTKRESAQKIKPNRGEWYPNMDAE